MGHLIRTLLLLVIVLIVGAYFLGYLPQTASVFSSSQSQAPASQRPPTTPDIETPRGTPPPKPLPSGDDLKDRAARAAQQVDEKLAEAALTGKIKAKIALDDTLKSADVHVRTTNGIVTLSGSVGTAAMRDRIIQLARETAGVKQVVNEITVSGTRS
jgi:hyperosmotically inducible protein